MAARRLALALLLSAGVVVCQNAQLCGVIQDPTSGAIVGADITIRNELTGGRRVTRSNESGIYTAPSLKPGLYKVTVQAAGFETLIREGVTLRVGENARLDFAMALGDARTVVTVAADPSRISTEDGSIGTVIDRGLLERMPLNGRGIQMLIGLTPAVSLVPVSARNAGGQFVTDGQRSDSNYFTIDGVSVNFAARAITDTGLGNTNFSGRLSASNLPALSQFGTFSNLVSPEALQEFRIQTSSFAPEFGRVPGGQIGLITRSGTNRFAGSLFEYLRNEATDANGWFNNYHGVARPALRFHNFGGSLGGPVLIPRVYGGIDRTFFFVSVEDVLLHQPRGAVQTLVPSEQTREHAPSTLAALLSAVPLPNRPPSASEANTPGFGLFVGTGWLKQDQKTYGLKIDHSFSDRIALFARYNDSPSETNDRPFPNLANTQRYTITTRTFTVGLTQTVRPNLVHEMRWNASSQDVMVRDSVDDYGGAKRPVDSALFPTGYSGVDSSTTIQSSNLTFSLGLRSSNRVRQLQWVDSLSWVSGTHQFKAGIDFVWISPVDEPPRLSSTTVFGSSIYNGGTYSDITAIVFESRSLGKVVYSIPSFSAFAQDVWRPTRRWTLAYGARWEINPAPAVKSGHALFLNQLSSLQDFTQVSPLSPGNRLYPTQFGHFAPRIGMAWQLFDAPHVRTTLRAGAGVFYDTAQNGFTQRYAEPQGYLAYLNTPFGQRPAASDVLTIATPLVYQIAAAPGYTLPRTFQWNVTLEQALGPQTFSAAYVGAAGRDLTGTLQSPPVAPANYIYIRTSRYRSSFHSLQLQFDRRLARRVRGLVSYTWSHSIDNLSNDTINAGLSSYLHPDINRGSSDFDIRQSLSGAVLLELPAPNAGAASALLRNWAANLIFIARSAPPLDVGVTKLANSELILRPDVVAGQPLYLYGSGYPGGKRLNPAAFAAPRSGADQGTLGRNVVRAFGAWQTDLSLERRIAHFERVSLQIRADAFNVFNHPNFAGPTNFLNSPQTTFLGLDATKFGYSSASLGSMLGLQNVQGQLNPAFQVGQSRSLQFGLRLRF